jgi:hypothetical protein
VSIAAAGGTGAVPSVAFHPLLLLVLVLVLEKLIQQKHEHVRESLALRLKFPA